MNVNQPEPSNVDESAEGSRKAWKTPTVTHLRAGSAENTAGARVNDATLERIGS